MLEGALIAATSIAALVAYLSIGLRLASRRLPSMWEKARKHWSSKGSQRSSVRGQLFWVAVSWPAYFAFAGISRRADRFIDAGDPVLIRQRERESGREKRQLEARIAELEQQDAEWRARHGL